MFKLSPGMASFGLLLSTCLLYCQDASAQKLDYKPVSGTKIGPAVPLSPDPLVSMRWPSPKATDDLQYYHLSPVSFSTASPASFDTRNFRKKNEIVVNGKGDIRFDFGKVSAGWLEFESDDLTDSVLLSISEYNEPAVVNIGTAHPFKTAAVIKDGSTYRIQLNDLWYEGVRFGWVHVKTHQKQWHIKNFRLVCQIKPTNYNGSFDCSDPELTKIWYTGAYTVKLNLMKDYFGAILMDRSDRHSWTGDAFPAQAASMVAFGNYDFVRKNLNNTANLSNDIASYALYWVLSLVDYVNYTGDTELASQYLENAGKKLDLAYAQFGKSPRINFYGWDERLGGGFENPNAEAQNAYSMLSIRAWSEYSKMMRTMGNAAAADKYQGYAMEKIASIRKENTWLSSYGLHAAADAINTDLTTKEENALFFNKNFNDRVNRLSYSSFNQWFVISAMAKSQRFDEAISSIKDSWGGQLRYGGTTFFEVFRPQWNDILNQNDAPPNNQAGYTSFTHPWSAGIVKWLSEEILGIKPVSPGFKEFSIMPHIGSSLTMVKGSTPTGFGLISASFDTRSGKSRISIPVGTLAKKIALPLGKNVPASLKINGKSVNLGTVETGSEDFLIVNDLGPGEYLFELKYKKTVKPVALKESTWNYTISSINQDSLTGSKWKGIYGGDGSILFNPVKKGEHLQTLPAYLGNVKLNRYADVHRENFGSITTKDYRVCEQSMTIDLPVTDNSRHRITVYFLDEDNQGRRSVIEVFDKNSLNLIGPLIYVKNYNNKGKYVSFDYQGPIRLRINQVRGINVSVSGLFFDKSK
ncbi:MAG: alpha-L-rhamnosidase C-terminal domain-containing protein [Bacteroidota bacterium]